MQYTVHKWFWAWDFEKEETWLNAMSAKGMQLIGVGFCKYIFDEGRAGEYTVRIELLNQFPTHPESIAYIHFLEDAGVQHVGSVFRWVYFRKKSSESSFDLFSDIDSRINHLKRILTLFICLLPLQISSFVSTLTRAIDGSIINTILFCLLAVVMPLLSVGIGKVWFKIRKLRKERILRE